MLPADVRRGGRVGMAGSKAPRRRGPAWPSLCGGWESRSVYIQRSPFRLQRRSPRKPLVTRDT